MAINLGSIFFGIQAITTGFQQAAAQVALLGAAAAAAANQHRAAQQAINQHSTSIQSLARASSLVTGPLSGVGYRITVLGELFTSANLRLGLFVAGMVGAAYGFTKLSEAAIKNEIDLAHHKAQLLAVLGSTQAVDQQMKYLMDTANKFGVPFDEVANNFVRLQLAARGTRLEGEGIDEVFQNIIAYSSKFQLSQEQLTTVLGHVETALSRGRIQWREVQQVLSHDIPDAANLAAKAMGMTRAEFDIHTKRGDVLSDDFWLKFSRQINIANGIDVAKPADSLAASLNRLKNAQSAMLREFDNALGIGESYHKTIDRITIALDYMRDHMRELLTIISTVGAAMLATFAVGKAYAGLLLLAEGVVALKNVILGLNVAMALSPAGLLVKALQALVVVGAALYAMNKAKDSMEGTFKERSGDMFKDPAKITVHPIDPLEESGPDKRIRLAKESIARFTSESNRQFNAMKEGPQALQDALEQIDIEKKIEGWRKALEENGLTDLFDEITPRVNAAREAFTKLRDAQKADKDFVTTLQLMQTTFDDLGKTGVGNFVDAVMKGTDLATAFKNTWSSVLSTLYKQILQLAVVAPILNMLFGAKNPTITAGTPGSGIGGILGNWLGSAFGGSPGGANMGIENQSPTLTLHGGSAASSYRYVNPNIFSGAPRLHGGLTSGEYPAILQSGEEVIPRGGRTSSGVEVHVHEAPGQPTSQIASKTPDGRIRLDIMMKQLARDAVAEDVSKGGSLGLMFERRYGLDRTKGMAA